MPTDPGVASETVEKTPIGDVVAFTLHRHLPGSSSAAVIRVLGVQSREVQEDPGIVSDLTLAIDASLWGQPPSLVTQQGGVVGDRFVSASEQPFAEPGQTYLAVFDAASADVQVLEYTALMPDSDHVNVAWTIVPLSDIIAAHDGGGQ